MANILTDEKEFKKFTLNQFNFLSYSIYLTFVLIGAIGALIVAFHLITVIWEKLVLKKLLTL